MNIAINPKLIASSDDINRIYAHLINSLRNKTLTLGDKLPTEYNLASTFNVSRMTAHYAIQKLEKDGLVKRNKRQGTIITQLPSEAMIAQVINVESKLIYVLYSPYSSVTVHWEENTSQDIRDILKQVNFTIKFKLLPTSREHLQAFFDEIAANGCFSVIILPEHHDYSVLIDNLDILINYKGEIYLYNLCESALPGSIFHELTLNYFEEGYRGMTYLSEVSGENTLFCSDNVISLPWAQKRCNGARLAYHNTFKKELHVISPENAESWDDYCQKLCKRIKSDNTTKWGLIFANDQLAINFMDYALAHEQLISPQDFWILGFDNLEAASTYKLTTFAPPVKQVAPTITKMVMEQSWEMQKGARQSVKLSSQLIIRETA